jgi:hypothetical protein
MAQEKHQTDFLRGCVAEELSAAGYTVRLIEAEQEVTELNAGVPGMVRVKWDNPQAAHPPHHPLTWYAAVELDWYTRPAGGGA